MPACLPQAVTVLRHVLTRESPHKDSTSILYIQYEYEYHRPLHWLRHPDIAAVSVRAPTCNPHVRELDCSGLAACISNGRDRTFMHNDFRSLHRAFLHPAPVLPAPEHKIPGVEKPVTSALDPILGGGGPLWN